jgi:hypothetical protein
MSDWTSPMTKLEAVNICLAGVSQPPVESLDGAPVDAELAEAAVNEQLRSVLGKGWHWNREKYTLSPDTDGFIYLPNNCARVAAIGDKSQYDVIQRGQRLFDRIKMTYVFTKALDVEMYVFLEFEDLPHHPRDYIAARAAMVFQQRTLGSDTMDKDLKALAQDAWNEMIRTEVRVAKPNMLRDNWSSQSIVQRGFFSRGAYL